MTPERLGNMLASLNIIDGAAINDPDGYDGCLTMGHIAEIIPDLEAEFDENNPALIAAKREVEGIRLELKRTQALLEFAEWRIKRLSGEVPT